jgi:hypothetical protein
VTVHHPAFADPMLHVTNGDAAVASLAAAGVEGPILPWRDVLHEGPVPAGVDGAELRRLRARFLAGPDGPSERVDDIERELTARDAALDAALDSGRAMTLWFEHDLYDQLQLVQILARIEGRARRGARRDDLRLVQTRDYLGTMRPAAIRQSHAAGRSVDDSVLRVAREAWSAFRAPDPRALDALVRDGDLESLPCLRAALRRQLEELPSSHDGLSRTERQALEAIEGGAPTMADAYRRAHHDREEAIFLGDTTFAWLLAALGVGDTPLVTLDDGSPLPRPADDAGGRGYWSGRPAITEAGRRVLAGASDRVRLLGIDRWLGGVHLVGREVRWRWDGERVVSVLAAGGPPE